MQLELNKLEQILQKIQRNQSVSRLETTWAINFVRSLKLNKSRANAVEALERPTNNTNMS